MNFLAHFQLAWPDEGLIAGGLEGDFYKGPLRGELPAPIERGVQLHRQIDAFTDQHPAIVQLRRELPQGLRRYAGILIDLSFDHFLSRHWQHYSDVPLPKFNDTIYASLIAQESVFSPKACLMASRLVEYDILVLYRNWETVPATAERIGNRFKRFNPFVDIDRELTPCKDIMEEAFLVFYPELQQFSATTVKSLN